MFGSRVVDMVHCAISNDIFWTKVSRSICSQEFAKLLQQRPTKLTESFLCPCNVCRKSHMGAVDIGFGASRVEQFFTRKTEPFLSVAEDFTALESFDFGVAIQVVLS